VFFVEYMKAPGQRRRMVLDSYGVITPGKARKRAKVELGKASAGADPLEERRKKAVDAQERKVRSTTLTDLWNRYLPEYVEHPAPRDRKGCKPLSKRAADGYRWLWKTTIKPKLGSQRIDTLNREAIEGFHDSIADKPYKANRALQLLSGMLTFAVRHKLIASNPARGVTQFPEERLQRFLSSSEVKALAKALTVAENPPKAADGEEQIKTEPWQALAAIRLLLLTGARKIEVLTMKWEDLDLERGIWNLPTSKTGAREVRLSPPAVDLFQELDQFKGNPYVLPAQRGNKHFVGLQKVWERVRTAAGLEDVRIHDLRHSFASEALGAGLSLRVVQQLLGHAEIRTTERYAHLERDAVREAADRVGAALSAKLGTKNSAEVVEYKRRQRDNAG